MYYLIKVNKQLACIIRMQSLNVQCEQALILPLDLFYSSAASLTAIADSESFLFTLVNPSGNEPIKITRKLDENGGIRCLRDAGPAFGNEGYYDLQVWRNSKSNLDLGYGFTCPDNADKKKYFTGTGAVEITELEVFKIDIQTHKLMVAVYVALGLLVDW